MTLTLSQTGWALVAIMAALFLAGVLVGHLA